MTSVWEKILEHIKFNLLANGSYVRGFSENSLLWYFLVREGVNVGNAYC